MYLYIYVYVTPITALIRVRNANRFAFLCSTKNGLHRFYEYAYLQEKDIDNLGGKKVDKILLPVLSNGLRELHNGNECVRIRKCKKKCFESNSVVDCLMRELIDFFVTT